MKGLAGALLFGALGCLAASGQAASGKDTQIADPKVYLKEVSETCQVLWPENRTVNVVCHGHSVPAGYFQTPVVRTFEAYPYLMHQALAEKFPHAVINVIVTAIGGENAEGGAKRFEAKVLSLRPDVLTIDYALNDRTIGLERARKAWVSMIKKAQAAKVKVILLTPTPDMASKLDAPEDPLNQHAEQIRQLAREYGTGLADSQAGFREFVKGGGDLATLMAQGNHPNGKGHEIVCGKLMEWWP
ncbi:MAG: SGNH/GDSL hydrolase family protein [Verrucomicrobiota bacterium]